MKCPYCQIEHPDSLRFCTQTGKELPRKNMSDTHTSEMKRCPNCSNMVTQDKKFCTRCGFQFQDEVTNSVIDNYPIIAKEENQNTRLCPSCHSTVKADKLFCTTCGFKFPIEEISPVGEPQLSQSIATAQNLKECPNCHTLIPPEKSFCIDCGAEMVETVVPPEDEEPQPPVEENQSYTKKCPQCQQTMQNEMSFCTYCGYNFMEANGAPSETLPVGPTNDPIPQTQPCPRCGNSISQGAFFCTRCGEKISQPPTPTAAIPERKSTKPNKSRFPLWTYFLAGAFLLVLVALFLINRYPITAKRLLQFNRPTIAVENTVDVSQFLRKTSTVPVVEPTITISTPVAEVFPGPTFTATLTPNSLPDKLSVNNKDQAEMVYIPAGNFLMGSDPGKDPYFWGAESPSHKVSLNGYWIYRYEVTNAMYEACVKAGYCSKPDSLRSRTRESYFGNPQYANYPVIFVSYGDANTYCHWVGGRLPTEAEWERAARGDTDDRTFPWGWQPAEGNQANFCDRGCPEEESDPDKDDGYRDTSPVGNYTDGISPYGLYDVAGNVWEWVFDYFSPTYYQISPENNPRGPLSSTYRSIRGGGWNNPSSGMRVVQRYSVRPDLSLDTLGFRCAMDVN